MHMHKFKICYMSLLSSGEHLEYVHMGLRHRGDNPIEKTLIKIPRHMWSYPHRDLHNNGLK